MSQRNHFLERIMANTDPLRTRVSEAVDAADREDGIVDGFNVPLDAAARALSAKVKIPMARRLVAFMSMAGVPGRYLNAEEAEGGILAATDMLRKKASVRKAFLDLYNAMATAKGYATPDDKPVQEAVEDEDGDLKKGNYMQRLFSEVMIELGLPGTLTTATAPATVQAGLLKTATQIADDAALERALRTLAMRLGIKSADVNSKVSEDIDDDERAGYYVSQYNTKSGLDRIVAGPFKSEDRADARADKLGGIDAGFEVIYRDGLEARRTDEAVEVGQDEFAQEIVGLVTALGVPEEILNLRRPQLIQALRKRKMSLKNRATVLTRMRVLKDIIDKNTVQQGQGDEEK